MLNIKEILPGSYFTNQKKELLEVKEVFPTDERPYFILNEYPDRKLFITTSDIYGSPINKNRLLAFGYFEIAKNCFTLEGFPYMLVSVGTSYEVLEEQSKKYVKQLYCLHELQYFYFEKTKSFLRIKKTAGYSV